MCGIKPYTLRYWETEFRLLRPVRSKSGHRKYTSEDISTIERIKDLLYDRRFTISGAKRMLQKELKLKPEQMKLDFAEASAAISALREVRKEVETIIQELRSEL